MARHPIFCAQAGGATPEFNSDRIFSQTLRLPVLGHLRRWSCYSVKLVALICHLWHNIGVEFSNLVKLVGDEPVFETGLLLAGDVDANDVRRQLSRWTKAGRLYQLRRGLYMLAPPFQKIKPHPFIIANRIVRGSYVSCQSALALAGLIPEYVPVIVSVTTRRPRHWETPLGRFVYRHVKTNLWRGYRQVDLGGGQSAFVAIPEKALLDLIHLHPGADSMAYLKELRLQNLDQLDLAELQRLADSTSSPKLKRAAKLVAELAQTEAWEYVSV
jgi:hypothetical protein